MSQQPPIASAHAAPALRRSLIVILAAFASHASAADPAGETTLTPVTVTGSAPTERADGPVPGYRAARSATFTKTDTPLRDVPASISVVPESLIKDQAMDSLADVLRYVPGTTMGQGEGNRDQPVLRGINTTADFFVDGVRDDAQYFRDLYNAERVEVLKGPGGMTFGRGGAGGVINRVTKKPSFAAQAGVDLTLGSHDQRRLAADVGNRLSESAAWRLNAMGEKANSFRDGGMLERWAVNPTATFILGGDSTLTVGVEHLDDERTADRGIPSRNGAPFATAAGTFFGNAAQSISKAKVDSATAALDHKFGNGVQLRNTLRATHYDKFYQNVYANGAVNAAGNVAIAAYNNASDQRNVFNQTDLVTRFTTGNIAHTVLGGIEIGRQDIENRRITGRFNGTNATSVTVAASNPFALATSFSASASDANNQVTADVAAAYVQDQLALSDQWKLLAGVRYDRFTVKFDDRRTANQDLARTDRELSPRVGLIWQPTAGSTYYASYSTSFLPSGETLSLAANTAQIAPETAINTEIGARWDLLPALTLSAAVFRTDRDDVKAVDPTDNTRLIQTGLQRTEGVEVGLQGEVTRQWQVYAGYANLDARIEQTTQSAPAGRTVGLVPRHAASLWNKVDLDAQWSLGLGMIHQSAMYTSVSNAVRLPAFSRVDGAVYYRLADGKTRVALNLENLLDKQYYPTAHNDNNISTGAPRSAQLTVSTRF